MLLPVLGTVWLFYAQVGRITFLVMIQRDLGWFDGVIEGAMMYCMLDELYWVRLGLRMECVALLVCW